MGHTSRELLSVCLCACACVHAAVSKGNGRDISEMEGRTNHLYPGPPSFPQGFLCKKVSVGLSIKVLFQIKVILMLLIESEETVIMRCSTFM